MRVVMQNFEVTLYNKAVRRLTEEGESHPQFDDGWGDQRFIQIEADSPEDARRKVFGRYPERKGFVIIDIIELPDYV